MVEADKKRELILEGAIKRFCHFGVSKTSMAEIAEDLSVSKPSLYYYFPDKQSLIVSVAERIITAYLDKLETTFIAIADREEALMTLIEMRRSFFEKYFMLHMEEDHSDAYLKDPAFIKLIHRVKEREAGIIARHLQQGIDQGEILEINASQTAELLLDTLRGIKACMRSERMIFPDADTFDQAFNKMKAVTRIFLNGIKRTREPHTLVNQKNLE